MLRALLILLSMTVPFSFSAASADETPYIPVGCPKDPDTGLRIDEPWCNPKPGNHSSPENGSNTSKPWGININGPFGPIYRDAALKKPTLMQLAVLSDFRNNVKWAKKCFFHRDVAVWATHWARAYHKRIQESFNTKNIVEAQELRARIEASCK